MVKKALVSLFLLCVVILPLAAQDSMDARITKLRGLIYYGGDKNLSAVKEMLDTGNIDINFQMSDGSTLLHTAAREGQPEMVKLLLERGSDPTIKDDLGQRPVDVARNENHRDIVKLLGGNPAQGPDGAWKRQLAANDKATQDKPATPQPAPKTTVAQNNQKGTSIANGSDHCRKMYAQTYKLCDRSDYSCKQKAHQGFINCEKKGTWY